MILGGGPFGLGLGLPTKPAQTEQQVYNQAYFTGLAGLGADDRANWEKKYAKEIAGLDDEERDNYFRNTIFMDIFGNSDDEEDKKIFANRSSLTRDQRDSLIAQKAISSDIDAMSDLQESPLDLWKSLVDADYKYAWIDSKLGDETARQGAMRHLEEKGLENYDIFYNNLMSLDTETRDKMLSDLDNFSGEVSPYYKMYNGTDKLNLSPEEKVSMLATYLSNESVGGTAFAAKALGNSYQDIVASNQSVLEKAWNSGAQFIDSAAGMIIRAAGMVGGAVGIGLEDDESWLENVIDNTVTRYGDRIATTNSWSPSEQESLELLGMSDNPIINTVDQQNALMSANTPFELFGQYGFTTASTILSFGGSSVLQGATKGAAWLGKVAMGGKTLNATAKGTKFLRGVIKARNIGNVLIPGAVGTVEGGMNAAMTKQETLRGLEQDINDRFTQTLDGAITGGSGLEGGVQSEEDIDKAIIGSGTENCQAVLDAMFGAGKIDASKHTSAEVAELVKQRYRSDKAAAEESANTAMYYDFWTNSVINGMVNSTWKAGLEAPRVQNALRKIGLGGGESPVSEAVNVARQGDRWVAQARQATRGQLFKSRLKEALGEGFEEYTQDISSAFGQAYANDKMQQYIDNKYGANPGATAAQNDFWQSFAAGIQAAGNAAVSPDAIKSGLYGALSTAMGGPNIAMKQGANGNMRASGITWRSAITPLISNKERDAINEQREKMAEHFNNYFSDETMQRALFNAGGTAEWLTQMQQSIESNDEKGARDARVGQMFSNIITLNDLEGTGYHDAVVANLQARAGFNEANLADPESEESKSVEQLMASAAHRTQNLTREEALQTIKKNATEMLNMMDMVSKETRSIEKIFGENIDQDVKASMVFNRVVIDDYKKRIGQLDDEISQVTTELGSQENLTPTSSPTSKGRRLIARFGSLSNAISELQRMEQQKSEIDQVVREMEGEESDGHLSQEDQATFAMAKEYQRVLARDIKAIKEAREEYSTEARHMPVERDGITYDDPVDSTVLSAEEIMRLSASDRAFMLDPKHKDRYSQEQQAEIDKVNSVGTSIHQDFNKKVADRSRIERDYKAAMTSQFNLMYSPKALNRYVNKVKLQAQQRMLQKKNEDLIDLAVKEDDYWRFSERLDEIYNNGDQAEISAVEGMLSGRDFSGVRWLGIPQEATDMFERYQSENQRKAEVYDWAERNGVFEENDPRADVFAATLDYLTNSGVDIADIESGAQSLLETTLDEDGNPGEYYFEQHLARANERSPIEEQVNGYSSIEETIQTYRDVMSRYNAERQQRELDNEEVVASQTDEAASEPAVIPEPQTSGPSLFDIGGSTPEAGHLNSDGERVGTTTVSDMVEQAEEPVETPQEEPQATPVSVVDKFTENSNEEVGKAAEIALRNAENAPSFSPEAKSEVKSILEELADYSFDSVDDFLESVTKRANALDSRAEDDNRQVPDLLRHVVAKVQQAKNSKESITTPSSSVSPFFDRRRRTIQTQARRMNYNMFGAGPNAGYITSINIAHIRQNHPDSIHADYYDKYGIEDALRDGVLSGNPDVMFITDSNLTDAVRNDMESKGIGYTENDLPIVAVVETSNGPITINVNGQDKHFQPVSIMSATGVEYSAGSNNMAPIRRLASSNGGGVSIVKNADGSPVVTKPMGQIKAVPNYDSSRRGQDNNNVLDVGQSDLSENERDTPQGYQKAKRKFLKSLGVVKVSDTLKKIVFHLNKLNGATHPIDIFIAPVQRTTNKNGQSVTQVRDDADGLISFNSRTRRAAKAIGSFIESFTDEEMSFNRDSNGQVIPLGDTAKLLESYASGIESRVSNFINIASKSGWHYAVNATDQSVDGKRVYSIDLVNDDGSSIQLTAVHQGMTEEQSKAAQHQFLRNLLMDETGEVRMSNDRDSLAKWQVPFSDVERASQGDENAKKNLSDIYDDGYLEVSATNTSFQYTIQGIALQSPFKRDGSPVYQTVANTDNATPSSPLNSPAVVANGQVEQGETIIDSDTGVVIQGQARPQTNPAAERAKEVVDRIVEDSKGITLSDDGSGYVDSNGTRYARVTSIIAADIEAGERFDPNSPWVTPSTNIGTGVDEFVRDFFAGKATDFSKYPNATPESLQKFAEQLAILKNQLELNGLTVVPRDVTVTGQIEVADSNGKIHSINVAGTLDLLAYDGKGNFYIFDMKTNRSGIDQHKRDKYARQLSLYKELLEKKYGVQVKSLNILPIGVTYPAPAGARNGVADYSVSPESPNQLLIDGKEYREANPQLQQTIAVPYKPLHIVYDRLTDAERGMISGIEDAINEGNGVEQAAEPITPVEAQVADPVEAPVDTTLGLSI
jgi:hypothetical protein